MVGKNRGFQEKKTQPTWFFLVLCFFLFLGGFSLKKPGNLLNFLLQQGDLQ